MAWPWKQADVHGALVYNQPFPTSHSSDVSSTWEHQPGDYYLSSSCTGCNQPVLSSFLLQPVCHCGDQPAARGTEWVAQGQGSSPQVKLLHGWSSHLHPWVLQFVKTGVTLFFVTNRIHLFFAKMFLKQLARKVAVQQWGYASKRKQECCTSVRNRETNYWLSH